MGRGGEGNGTANGGARQCTLRPMPLTNATSHADAAMQSMTNTGVKRRCATAFTLICQAAG